MKIQSISNLNILYPQKLQINKDISKQRNISFAKNLFAHFPTRQKLEIDREIEQEESYYKSFLKQKGKVTKEQYQDIIANHPRVLSKCYILCDKQDEIITKPERIAKFALALKEYYDSMYENYTIISIGTSPEPVTEVMQNIGCNVVYAPISGLRMFHENPHHPIREQYPTIASRYPNVEILMQYLLKKGISKKEAGDLILLDFTSSGKTLDLMVRILMESKKIKSDKINDHSIIHDLREAKERSSTYNLREKEIYYFYNDLIGSKLEHVSNIPHFTYDDEPYYGKCVVADGKKPSVIFEEFDNFSTPKARAWALCSTHEAMKLLNNIS